MYRLGWNERNGGNISLILDEDEIKEYLDINKPLFEIEIFFDAKEAAGRLFALTRAGSFFKNVESDPAYNLGIIKINPDGKSASVIWGLAGNGRPTSELPSHLMSHIVRLRHDPKHRVVTHCHATGVLAMSYVHKLDEREFTRTLWRMINECFSIFPEGVGLIPWMVNGNDIIGRATAEKMEHFRSCVWPHHGLFASGSSLDEAFGLIEIIDKAAQVYLMTMDKPVINTITDDMLKELAKAFNIDYRREFLD
jgi:rhamnulose-1-phosphate aldolase